VWPPAQSHAWMVSTRQDRLAATTPFNAAHLSNGVHEDVEVTTLNNVKVVTGFAWQWEPVRWLFTKPHAKVGHTTDTTYLAQ